MSATPVPFAPDTLETIRRAFRSAADRRHDLVTLEHLLRALIDDPEARAALHALNVDLAQLTHDLDDLGDQLRRLDESERSASDMQRTFRRIAEQGY